MSKIAVTIDDTTFPIEVNLIDPAEDKWSVSVAGEPLQVVVPRPDPPDEPARHPNGSSRENHDVHMDWLVIDDHPYEIVFDPGLRWIHTQGQTYRVSVRDLDDMRTHVPSGDGRIKAPIPGQITRILVEPGQRVEQGSTVMILEAMKMENHILAPVSGVVSSLGISAGQTVMLNQVLAEIAPMNE